MKLPLQITFRDMPSSESVAREVREKAEKLDEVYGGIMGCRVAIEPESRRRHQGNVYRVRIDMTVPGEELVVGGESAEEPHQRAYEDVYVAVHEAFDGARRLLQEYVKKQRGEVKTRVGPPHGRVARIFPDSGYGFLEAEDGYDVYFHKNSVLNNGFSRLAVGTEVRYEEELGEKGPQASTVAIVGKGGHGHRAA
ncbi:HPF/RaiA family ribosome-associated protein [Polyangium jinanense]|uniref:HPF/RaiA family ribosome-associated protein n=1 Tax=Polyangium jinanense TaxID=2829994 RepID=A0A9X4AX43_9BACT|nr:HPF/RaiA family ribosome-associated protein [Polyangium jinanense]MDC3958873.1 HPF/RaiA family ribosome-associated protein [Polyangium jinanense]MDC3985987.1 HPF/RaiA family ribosome-associated protein [Polyangium jinanense]